WLACIAEYRGRRPAERVQPLHTGWCGEYGCQLQHVRDSAVDRCVAGVQSANGNLPRRVRARDNSDQRFDQAWNEPVPRNAIRVSAERQARRETVCLCGRAPEGRAQMESVWFHCGRPRNDTRTL